MAGVRGRSGGHNRKSLAEHQLAGTYRKGRHANLVDIKPPANPTVPKPAYLSVSAALAWDQLAPICAAMGTLTPTDVRAFTVLCELQGTQDAICAMKSAPGFQPFSGGKPDPAFRLEREGAAALRP